MNILVLHNELPVDFPLMVIINLSKYLFNHRNHNVLHNLFIG
ncbi:hypothetical protein BMETH_516_0 [methanotrophic bacterial endosymbiont of Bathymodiolus sp.]|nr:hypothetical protein BMETH_516_0 [methanotrophic bacterial endosymbiont of Bathymodiolus sp.]